MSIQTNFPAIAPTLNLSFALTKALDPRITFSRASTATYYGTQTAKAEENLALQSTTVGGTGWSSGNVTLGENTGDTTAPDGTSTALKLTDNATDGAHRVITNTPSFALSTALNTNYTASVFVKAGTLNHAYLVVGNATTANRYAVVVVDLTNGTITQTDASATTTLVSSGVQTLANGWYRVWLVAAQSSTAFTRIQFGSATSATGNTISNFGDVTYAGSGDSVYFWGPQFEQRSAVTAYTPTTTEPITNYIPVLETAASGVARFDHNPTTFESLGLLIEEQRANLILQSEDFSTTWAATRSTVATNQVVAPSGSLTADILRDSTDNDTHFVSQSVTTTAVAITFSLYAKAAGRNFVTLTINDSGNVARTTFYNLSTGAVGTTGTGITASVVSVGNGWYRCIATVGTALAGSNPCVIGTASADNTASYAGNGFSGVAIWGAQVE